MVIKVENLVKRYEDNIVLDHFNLQVEKGKIVGLLGPNGSGKTTAINSILGLLSYDKGEIKVFGRKLKADSYELKSKIGLVPQQVTIFYDLTVEENIDYFCGLYIGDKKLRNKYVKEALDFVQLGKHKSKLGRQLSGGLLRRLNIACGISHKPELIFFDEPTVAVDAQSRNFILEGIKRLNKKGATIVYTSHYLEEVENLCDELVIMEEGRKLVKGSVKELIKISSISEKIIVEFINPYEGLKGDLKTIDNILEVEKKDKNYVLKFEKGYNNLSKLIEFIEEKNLVYENLYTNPPSLNDVYLELTGKELRDGEND